MTPLHLCLLISTGLFCIGLTGALARSNTILVLLGVKIATKFIGIWPLTKLFRFEKREGMYITLLMCTGLTFGSICALFGLNNNIINQDQYTVLVTAVIASAVVPTIIAQRWFQPIIEDDEVKEGRNA